MWGQGYDATAVSVGQRIIPMRVGTRDNSVPTQALTEDHPHACGDKKKYSNEIINIDGSSPCVWGQESALVYSSVHCRIIPMRVGTSKHVCYYQLTAQDHPHACGDKTKEIKENSGFAKSTA